ncbi:MAG: hypothetical protein AMXMBFR82_46150 [Candidatus Hydrogenedentota bacterium]
MPTNSKPTLTTLGTPRARSWTNDWIATVDATETKLNHRICGARLPDGTPCCNESDHPSGRCAFHGGFDLTGAPPGNRNHVIHGLYSRRLRPCTQSCPHWETCPIANRHPRACPGETPSEARENGNPSFPSSNPQSAIRIPQSAIRIPQSEPPQSAVRNPQFPTCPYQLAEYNTVLTDALAIVESQPHPNPMGLHNAHNVATLQVLVSTAAAQLTTASSLFEVPRASSPCPPAVPWASSPCRRPSSSEAPEDPHTPNPTPKTPSLNPNAILAFTRLMREYRHTLKLLQAPGYTPLNRHNSMGAPPTVEGILRHAERSKHDTGLDPDSIADAQLQPQTPETHAKAFIQQAALAGGQGRDVEMCEAFDNAALLDEAYAESERSHVLASYRPARHSVSEELAEAILGHLHIDPPVPKNGEITNDSGVPIPPSNAVDSAFSIPPSKGDQGGCSSTNSQSTDQNHEGEISIDTAKVLQDYLDTLRAGGIPPEAFPIGSKARAVAEAIYTGPSHTTPNTRSQAGLATAQHSEAGSP